MSPEAVVQGEKNIADLGERVEKGFFADRLVRALTVAEIGGDLTTKRQALKEGSKFLSQAIRESQGQFAAYPDSDIVDALIRTKTEEEGRPYLSINIREVVDQLGQYKLILDSLRKGNWVDSEQIKKTRWFFSHFGLVQLERSHAITGPGLE